MPLASSLLRPPAAPLRPFSALLLASALFGVLAMNPGEARADERCSQKCVQRQASCSASCSQGDKCRQRCNDSADTCFSKCQQTDDSREVAEQRRSEKSCFGGNGQMRKCTEAETQQHREAMKQASKLMCRGKNGEQIVCADQAKKLDDARKFIPKTCTGTGCKDDSSK